MRRQKVIVQESILVFVFLIIAAVVISLATKGNKLFSSIPFITMWLDGDFLSRSTGMPYYQMVFVAIFIAFLFLSFLHLFIFTEFSIGSKYIYITIISALLMYMFTHSHMFGTMNLFESILDLGTVITVAGIKEIGFYIGLTLQVFSFAFLGTNVILLFFYPQRRSFAVISLITFIVTSFAITILQIVL